MGIPAHTIGRNPYPAQILVARTVAEPPAHLHEGVIHHGVPQEVADRQPFQRQSAREGEAAHGDHRHAMFPALVIVQRLRPFRCVDLDNTCSNQNFVQASLDGGPVRALGIGELGFPDCIQRGNLGVAESGAPLRAIHSNRVPHAVDDIGHPRPQTPLDIGEARGVDQHRGMCRLLAPRIPDRPGDDKSAHGTDQAFRQHVDLIVDLVLHRKDVFVVVNQTDMPFAGIEKHLLRPEVV